MGAVYARLAGNTARATRTRPGAVRLAVLQAVDAGRSPRPSELATHLGLSRAAVTRHVQDLSASGLVDLTVDEHDRRSCFVTLTATGRKELDALTERGIQRFQSFTADWTTEDVQELARLLTKLEASIAAATRHEAPVSGRPWQRRTPPEA